MSAFIVSDDHISVLLTFAIDKQVSYYVPATGVRVDITAHNATEIGAMLLDENNRSVDARYNDGGQPGAGASYRFRRFDLPNELRAVSILKACSCFDYQACETDDYETTLAHRIIDAIRSAAIRALPGYDNAPGWELRRPQPMQTAPAAVRPATVIKLTAGQKAARTRALRRAVR